MGLVQKRHALLRRILLSEIFRWVFEESPPPSAQDILQRLLEVLDEAELLNKEGEQFMHSLESSCRE
jgi:hypothetical protein